MLLTEQGGAVPRQTSALGVWGKGSFLFGAGEGFALRGRMLIFHGGLTLKLGYSGLFLFFV